MVLNDFLSIIYTLKQDSTISILSLDGVELCSGDIQEYLKLPVLSLNDDKIEMFGCGSFIFDQSSTLGLEVKPCSLFVKSISYKEDMKRCEIQQDIFGNLINPKHYRYRVDYCLSLKDIDTTAELNWAVYCHTHGLKYVQPDVVYMIKDMRGI